MRAVLMAAGIGSRLGETVEGPKCSLDVAGKPLIYRTVEMLRNNDIEVGIVVGYKKERVYQALEGLDVKYYYNPYYKVTNSMASLRFAKDFIDTEDDLILGNADVFWKEDILQQLLCAKEDAVMLVDETKADTGDYFFNVDDGKIVAFGKDLPRNRRNCEYVGLAKLRKVFLPGFKDRLENCIESGIYNMWWENVLYNYCREYPIFAVDVKGCFWGEIDYIEDYERILDHVHHCMGENA